MRCRSGGGERKHKRHKRSGNLRSGAVLVSFAPSSRGRSPLDCARTWRGPVRASDSAGKVSEHGAWTEGGKFQPKTPLLRRHSSFLEGPKGGGARNGRPNDGQ
eukprot:9488057-Pyramimonas_sp.AAC.1